MDEISVVSIDSELEYGVGRGQINKFSLEVHIRLLKKRLNDCH